MRNLRQEEQEQKAHREERGERERQQQNEVKRRVAQKEQAIKNKVMIEEMQEIIHEKRKRSEMVQKRRMHRNQERAKINEADMKYIKGQMEHGRADFVSANSGQGAVLDLSMEAAAMGVSALSVNAGGGETAVSAEATSVDVSISKTFFF